MVADYYAVHCPAAAEHMVYKSVVHLEGLLFDVMDVLHHLAWLGEQGAGAVVVDSLGCCG